MSKKVNKIEALNLGMSGNIDPQEELRPVETINVDLNQSEGILAPTHAYSANGVTQDNLIPNAEKIYHLIDSQNGKHRLVLRNGRIYENIETYLSKDISISQVYGNTIYIGKGVLDSTYLQMKEDGTFKEYRQDVDPLDVFTNLIYEVNGNTPSSYLTIYSFMYKRNFITKEVFSSDGSKLSIVTNIVCNIKDPDVFGEIIILDICYDTYNSSSTTFPTYIYIWYIIDSVLKVGKIDKNSMGTIGTDIILINTEPNKPFSVFTDNTSFDKGIYLPSKIEVLNIPSVGAGLPTKRMIFAFSKANNDLLKANFSSVDAIYYYMDICDSTPPTTYILVELPFDYKSHSKLNKLGMLNSLNYIKDENISPVTFDCNYKWTRNRTPIEAFGENIDDWDDGYENNYSTDEGWYNRTHIINTNIFFRKYLINNTINYYTCTNTLNITTHSNAIPHSVYTLSYYEDLLKFKDKNILFDWYPGMPDNSILALRKIDEIIGTETTAHYRFRSKMDIYATPNNPFGYWNGDIYSNSETHWSTGTAGSSETVNAWGDSNSTLNLRLKNKVGSNRGKCPVWRIVRHYTNAGQEEVYIDIPYTGYMNNNDTTKPNGLFGKDCGVEIYRENIFPYDHMKDYNYRSTSTYSYCFPGMWLPFLNVLKNSGGDYYGTGPSSTTEHDFLLFNFNELQSKWLNSFDYWASIFMNMYGNFGVTSPGTPSSIYSKAVSEINLANDTGDSWTGNYAGTSSWYGKGYIYGGQIIPDGEYKFLFHDVVVKAGCNQKQIDSYPTADYETLGNKFDSGWKDFKGDSRIFFRFKVSRLDSNYIFPIVDISTDLNDPKGNWYAYDNFHIQCHSAVDTTITSTETDWNIIKNKINRNHTVENPLTKIDNENILVYDSINPYLYDEAYKYSKAQQLMITGRNSGNYIIPYGQSLYKFKSVDNSNFPNNAVIDTSEIIVDKDKDGEDIKINDITSIDAKKEYADHSITYTRNTPYEDGLEGHDGVQSKIYRGTQHFPDSNSLSGYSKIFQYELDGTTPYWVESSNSASAPFKILQSFPPSPTVPIDGTHPNGTSIFSDFPYIVIGPEVEGVTAGNNYFFTYDTMNKDYSLFPHGVNWADEQTLFYNRGFKITSINLMSSSEKGFSETFHYRYGYCFETKNGNFSNFVGWKYDGHNSKDDRYLKAIVNKYFLLEKGISSVRVFMSYTTKGSDNWSIPEEIYSVQLEELVIYLDTALGVKDTDEEITLLIELISGQTYESLAGVSHTLIDTTLNYKHSVVSNNYNFVIDATNESISAFKESKFLLFRSKKDLLTTFDWANDYLRIPETVVGLAAIHGKIVIFSTDNISIVDAETMEFIQVVQELEIINKDAWCLIEDKVMVISCKTGAYIFDGTEFTRISQDIEHNWKDDLPKWKPYPKVFTLAKDSKVYFWNLTDTVETTPEDPNTAGTQQVIQIKALVWHYPSKKWGYEMIPTGTTMIYNDIFENIPFHETTSNPSGENPNTNGERYFFVNNQDYKLIDFDGSVGVKMTYKTNPLDMGMPDIKKVLYAIRFRMKEVSIDNNNIEHHDFKYYEYSTDLPKYFYNAMLNITVTNKKIYSIEIMYRELIERGSRFTSTTDGIDPTLEINIDIP